MNQEFTQKTSGSFVENGDNHTFFQCFSPLNLTAIAFFSFVTLAFFAYEEISSDMLMYSLMSLKNVTLFYWDQNRILNIVPFCLSWISNPALNIAATMLLFAMSTFTVLFIIAECIALLFKKSAPQAGAFSVFIILSLAFLTILTPAGVFLRAVAHPEYPLSLLFALWALAILLQKNTSILHCIFSFILLILSIGTNYSIVIVCIAFAIFFTTISRKISLKILFYSTASILSLIFWRLTTDFSSGSYGRFSWSNLLAKSSLVLNNFNKILNTRILLLLCIAALFLCIMRKYSSSSSKEPTLRSLPVSRIGTVVFCLFWFILFVGNYWVEKNDFSERYFTYCFYSMLFLWASYIGPIRLFGSRRAFFTAAGITLLVMPFFIPLSSLHPKNFASIKRVESLTPERSDFYAGDYWLSWPAVFRDLLAGKNAFGLSYRGEGDKKGAQEHLKRTHRSGEVFSVLCLKSAPEECIKQSRSILGDIISIKTVNIREDVHQIDFIY